ncbi:MAG TPA: LPS export ABC transporter periplasmic protein LptC [Cyclobacteriaceae bacterium]|nr:LPS export ABC transporter periplasmic protein LptC [Cyclobacteriaceae bacterium]
MRIIGLLILSLLFAASCREDVDKSQLEFYDGPMRIGHDIELLHSDSAVVVVKLVAAKQLVFQNGDIQFPEGILIHFYEKTGELSSTIRADRGFYERRTNIYRGEGDVRVHNIPKEQKLSSEELFWDPNKKIIYTDKFVTVEEPDRLIQGTGMEADEGFNSYRFDKVSGIIDNIL